MASRNNYFSTHMNITNNYKLYQNQSLSLNAVLSDKFGK